MTDKLAVSCDCAKCGTTMQNESILSNDEYRCRIHFKCYKCGNEVVVNRWWFTKKIHPKMRMSEKQKSQNEKISTPKDRKVNKNARTL